MADQCRQCHYYAYSPYLVCADHPLGPEGGDCADFTPDPTRAKEEATYCGEVIPEAMTHTTEEQWALLDWHPIFTGRCPNCEMPMLQTTPPRVHWDCEDCGWKDDSV